MSDQSRKLAAIMFTDIVGYTAIMQKDEQSALMMIDRHRKVLEAASLKFNGRILQYYGDGSLSIFPSAYDAVECAMNIQRELAENPRVPLRIGIHLGDIIVRGDSVYGDGVNVASRIESLGMAGSILFSDTIYHLIRNQPDIKTKALGKFDLKNVDHPVPVYALANEEFSIPRPDHLHGKTKLLSRKGWYVLMAVLTILMVISGYVLYPYLGGQRNMVVEEKSIAVLPFSNLSNDPDQDYFSDGITEDILNHLSKVSDLKVKSRTSTQQYKNTEKTIPEIGREMGVATILEGSVRKSGNTVRIVAQLIDVRNDVHIWTETFDREITEIFGIQSEIAIEIANALKAKLSQSERRHIRREFSRDITAYDYALRARQIWRNWNDEKDLENALQLLEQAIQLDPGFALGHVMIGEILYRGMRDYGVPPDVWINQAFSMAEWAIRIDSTMAKAYLLRGNILNDQMRKPDEALKDLQKAYELDPGNPEVLNSLGYNFLEQGQYDKGARLVIKALEVGHSPKDPEYFLSWGKLYQWLGEYEKSETLFLQAKNLAPGWISPYSQLGYLYRAWEKYDQAIEYYNQALEISPMDQNVINAIAWTNLLAGNLEEAARYWAQYEELEAHFTDMSQYVPFRHRLGYIYWLEGKKEQALELFDEQMKLDLERQQGLRGFGAWRDGSHFYDLAAVNSFLGNTQEALAWLDSASSKGFSGIRILQGDPLFDNIRKDPKLTRMMRSQKEEDEKMIRALKEVLKEKKEVVPVL
ncbi:MAG: tetratricopeptide repeat protein [Cyclobacteriaceae bacterium]|nr:tetratricopeptide repeat protein [Cyclobacteriaceae bacterium]